MHAPIDHPQLSLFELRGLRELDGRGEFILDRDIDVGQYDSARVFLLRLDGVIYWFQEDPVDGYRSGLKEVKTTELPAVPPGAFVEFPPIMVMCRVQEQPEPDSYRQRDFRLYGVSESTGLVVFEIGEENIDDYYPSFVARWEPEGYTPQWLSAAADD